MSELNDESQKSGTGIVADASFQLPPEKDVVMYNDDFTSMDFVVEVLISVFNKSKETAESLMMQIHQAGSAIVGTYTYDIAVSRANLAQSLARKNEFPLRVEVE
ncbi:MAG: ATP-dependent Clp protease adaptor ClpS [Treponema sp.]|nr:ATP-dependent Clp protease adaptor ClpS [Treponema sp.]